MAFNTETSINQEYTDKCFPISFANNFNGEIAGIKFVENGVRREKHPYFRFIYHELHWSMIVFNKLEFLQVLCFQCHIFVIDVR